MTRRGGTLRDFLALTKPGVTRMCVLTTAGGLLLAPVSVSAATAVAGIAGTAACVAGANVFNMWWERGSDGAMARTAHRPIPTGRISPVAALRFAWALSLLGVATLAIGTNGLSAVLGALAIAGYVLVYTPLKRRTPLALVIGAVPGAMPPLLGWTVATGSIDPPAWVLFGILAVWQIPHFLAIALFRKADYAAAGIRVVPVVRGDAVAKIQAVAWATLLVPMSLLLTAMGVTGAIYTWAAVGLGILFLALSFSGLDDAAGRRWARGYFFGSLVYLPALILALALDAVV